MRTANSTLSVPVLIAMTATLAFAAPPLRAQDENDPIVTTKVEGKFHEVSHNVRMAIVGKGINIAHILPASDMLHRTGRDFGYEKDVYLDGETFEFCSAKLSHKLARIHPDNILMCPFTISVYVVPEEPEMVRISYRIPQGRPGSDAVVAEVVELMDSILEDANW